MKLKQGDKCMYGKERVVIWSINEEYGSARVFLEEPYFEGTLLTVNLEKLRLANECELKRFI